VASATGAGTCLAALYRPDLYAPTNATHLAMVVNALPKILSGLLNATRVRKRCFFNSYDVPSSELQRTFFGSYWFFFTILVITAYALYH
jgi:hypothetical protein